MANTRKYKPGEEADRNLELYVKSSSGKTLGEISVQKGNRIPPSRIEGADHYTSK